MDRKATFAAILRAHPGNESAVQRQRLMDALQQIGPITTIEARSDLDLMMPAARVHELRHGQGVNILTHWTDHETEAGHVHHVAVYALHPGKWRGA